MILVSELKKRNTSMPQESSLPNSIFTSPSKRILNLKASVFNNSDVTEEINDHELAHRKAEEAGMNYSNIMYMHRLISIYSRRVN